METEVICETRQCGKIADYHYCSKCYECLLQEAFDKGRDSGYNEGHEDGYQKGYSDGLDNKED